MKTFLKVWLVVFAVQTVSLSVFAQSAELKAYHGATLVEHDYNDGDSFFVNVDGQQLHIRLYFVDTAETEIYQPHDARRVQEQARYFGIERTERVMFLGKQASEFTRQVLSEPFTVYTSHARALGGAGSHRIYAFVVTSTGRDLGELLVETGLGRNFGVKRERYDGLPIAEVEMLLRDIEISAMLTRRGMWSETNPELIVESRSHQRRDSNAMRALMNSTAGLLANPLNINTATQRELERLPGVGPVTANRIMAKRPFASLDELKKVQGIGEKLFESIVPYLKLADQPHSNG